MRVNFNTITPKMPYNAAKTRLNYSVNSDLISFKGLNKTQKDNPIKTFFSNIFKKNQPCADILTRKVGDKNHNKEFDSILMRKIELRNGLEIDRNPFVVNDVFYKDKPVIVFNYFTKDRDGNEVVNVVCLESNNERLTQAQKAIYKIFSNEDTRNQLRKGNEDENPFRFLSNFDDSKTIEQVILDFAKNIDDKTWDDYYKKAEYISPIIFSANGKIPLIFSPDRIED